VVLEGINDLGHAGTSAPLSETVTADDLIAALRQLIARSSDAGNPTTPCTQEETERI